MDPISLLEKDHREAKKLFQEYEGLGDAALGKKQAIFDAVSTALMIHMTIEEEIFYPAVKTVRSKEMKDEVREADEEHHVAKMLISELKKLKPGDEQFDAKVTVLRENIEHHIKEEEGELFPNSRRLLGKERLEQLGSEMEDRKSELTDAYA
jgi:hemerythrin-like domain-containing protein